MGKKEKKEKLAKTSSGARKSFVILPLVCLMALILLPTTVLLVVGMLPTLIAGFFSLARNNLRVLTVGAMNAASCMPFLLQLWLSSGGTGEGHTFQHAVQIVSNPVTIVIMYGGALAGYLIEWAIGGIVSALMHQKGIARQKYITRRQGELVAKWGKEVVSEDFS